MTEQFDLSFPSEVMIPLNLDIILSSFESSDNIQMKDNGPYCAISDKKSHQCP